MRIKNYTPSIFVILLLATSLALSGCSLNLSTPTALPQTQDSNQAVESTVSAVQTMVAASTVSAIQTQAVETALNQLTKVAILTPPTATQQPTLAEPTFTYTPPLPSPTLTPTLKPTLTFTVQPPTRTATVYYTKTETPVPTQGAYQCSITSFSPKSGTNLKKGSDFDLKVTLKNIGTKTWYDNDVDFRYLSGDKFQKRTDAIDLPEDVDPGDSVTLVIDMLANQDEGSRSASWGLARSDSTFCWVSVQIYIK